VAVGAITAAKARAVIADYSLASALRSEHGLRHRFFQPSSRGARNVKPLEPRRVVPCDQVIEDPQGKLHIRRVSLSERGTTITITWRPNLPARRSRLSRGFMMHGRGPGGPLSPTLADDQGTQASAHFSGGGSDELWEGTLTSDRPLARDTAWIEIGGTRVELVGEPWPTETSIELLPEQPVAHAYLWRRLATRSRFHDRLETIEPAVDALVAAGAVDPEDPVLDDVRAVVDALPHHPGMGGAPARRRTPEPWRSLLARQGRDDGPEGAAALAAVTPVFDGFSVAVSSIESRPDGFGLDVDVAPGLGGRRPYARSLESGQLAWWAADDRGHSYLGQIDDWSGDDVNSSAEVGFWPALHPKARHLKIMATAETKRAVIALRLPWADQRAAASRSTT